MIPGSRVWKLTAACTALFAHGALAVTFFQGEEVQVEAQQGGTDVKIGTGFADMAVGTLTAETIDPEAIEPVEPEVVERAEPSETEKPDELQRADVTDPVRSPQTQPEPAETQDNASMAPQSVTERVEPPEVSQSVTVAPSSNVVIATPRLEAAKPLTTALAAVPLKPIAPTNPSQPVEAAQPQTPALASPQTPDVETLEAQEDIKAAPLASKRPQRRTKEFETANAPKVRQPQPNRQQPTSRGNAQQNATAGASSGNRDATPTRQGTATGTASAAGNAAANNYPGKVWSRLSRVRRPNGRGEAQVRFTIGSNGGVSSVSVVRSSGNSRFDRAAAQIVRRAGPFPRPPAGARRTFTFLVKGS